jgi:hypothetical protein
VVAHEPDKQRRTDPGGGHHALGRTQEAQEHKGKKHPRTEERGRGRQEGVGFHGFGVWVNDDAKMVTRFSLFDRFPEVERLFLVRFTVFPNFKPKNGDQRPEEGRPQEA